MRKERTQSCAEDRSGPAWSDPGHRDEILAAFPPAPRTHDVRTQDRTAASRDQLRRAGVPADQIHVAALCTFDHPALFHSYRRDGKQAGRLVAAIRSAPGTRP